MTPEISIKKRYTKQIIGFILILSVILSFVPSTPARAALSEDKRCFRAAASDNDPAHARQLCISLLRIEPASPEYGSDFTAVYHLKGQNLTLGANPTTIGVVWFADAYDLDTYLGGKTIATGNVEANKDGTIDQDFSQTLSSAVFNPQGIGGKYGNNNTLGVEISLNNLWENLFKYDILQFQFTPRQPRTTDSVEILTSVPDPDNAPLTYRLQALYYPAGKTEPSADSSLAVQWTIDGQYVNNAYDFSYVFPKAGTYVLKVQIKKPINATDFKLLAEATKTLIVGGTPVVSGEPPPSDLSLSASLLSIVNIILGVIFAILRWIIHVIGTNIALPLLQTTLEMDAGGIAGGPILAGWVLVRDIVNMLFILMLIAIGFGTMLKIESYNYKKLLVRVILMAILVNFSLVIGRIILQLGDLVQFTFLPQGNGFNGVKQLYERIWAMQDVMPAGWLTFSKAQALANTFSIIFQFIFELAIVITFAALAVFMLIRTMALWILLILSPFAYALAVLPATASLAHKWWSNFIKYVFFAPIIAFFIRLSFTLLDTGLLKIRSPGGPVAATDIGQYLQNIGDGKVPINFSMSLQLSMMYLMILAFLWAGLIATRQMGIFGANAIVGMAEKGMKFGLAAGAFLPKRGLGRLARWYNDTTSKLLEAGKGKQVGVGRKALFALTNPVNFFRGWGKRAEELKEISKGRAAAGGREVAEQLLTRGKLKIPYRQMEERRVEKGFMEDYTAMRKEALMRAAVDVEGMGGEEGDVRRRAIVRAAAQQGYLDDLLRMKHFANQYADKDGTIYSAGVLNRFMYGYLGHGEQAMRFMAEDMEDLGKQSKHYEYLGHAYYDPDSKSFKRGMEETGTETVTRGGKEYTIANLKNEWQAAYSAGELAKIGGRERAQIAPHNIVPLRAKVDANGNFIEQGQELKDDVVFGRLNGELDEFSKAILRVAGDAAALRDIHFAQSRTKNWVLSGDVDQNTGEIIVNDEAEFKKIENLWKEAPDYLKAMYEQHTGIDRKSISGLKIAWLNTDPATGNVTGKTTRRIGDPQAMPLPINKIISEEVADDPSHQLDKKQKGKVTEAINAEITNVSLGRINEQQLRQELSQKLSSLHLPAVKLDALVNDVYSKLENNTVSRYNPTSVLAKLDSRLKQHGLPKLDAGQMTALSNAVSKAVGKAYEEASRGGVQLGNNPAKLRQHITAEIQGVQGLPHLTAEDIELFVQHARPHA